MGDSYFGKTSLRSSGTGADTDGGGVTVTLAAQGANKAYTCTGIQASGDAAAIVTIESPAATILWRKRYAAAFTMSESFPLGTIKGAANAAMLVKVSAGTATSEANIQAFVIPA